MLNVFLGLTRCWLPIQCSTQYIPFWPLYTGRTTYVGFLFVQINWFKVIGSYWVHTTILMIFLLRLVVFSVCLFKAISVVSLTKCILLLSVGKCSTCSSLQMGFDFSAWLLSQPTTKNGQIFNKSNDLFCEKMSVKLFGWWNNNKLYIEVDSKLPIQCFLPTYYEIRYGAEMSNKLMRPIRISEMHQSQRYFLICLLF